MMIQRLREIVGAYEGLIPPHMQRRWNVAHLQLAFPIAEVESLEEPRPSRLPP